MWSRVYETDERPSACPYVAFAALGPSSRRYRSVATLREQCTIRDAVLTCARKPTWVGLIYRTETTTKNCKTEKLKSKSRYVRSNSESLGNHVVSSEEEKERLQWEGFAEKEGFGPKSGMKERVGNEKRIIITNKCNC